MPLISSITFLFFPLLSIHSKAGFDRSIFLVFLKLVLRNRFPLSVLAGIAATSFNGSQAARYSNQTHQINSNVHMQYDNSSFAPMNQFNSSSHHTLVTRSNSTTLALAPPPQQASLGYQPVQSVDANPYDWPTRPCDSRGVDEFFSEEEIRMRSHEILENEDMQHLLRVLGGATTSNLQEDGYGFPSYIPSPFPSYNYDDDRSRSSGKAVVGWLKIKAAMRWGIFIRKKAAERRAHLVELEDD